MQMLYKFISRSCCSLYLEEQKMSLKITKLFLRWFTSWLKKKWVWNT